MKLNEITAMATLHRYKRGHTPRIQKGLKHPTLAWNEIPFVTDPQVLVSLERLKNSVDHGPCLTGEVEEQCGPSRSLSYWRG